MPKDFEEMILPVVAIESVWPSPDFELGHLSDQERTPSPSEYYLKVNYHANQDTGYYRAIPLNLLSFSTNKSVESEGSFQVEFDPTLVYLELDDKRFNSLSSPIQRLIKQRELSPGSSRNSVNAIDGVMTNFLTSATSSKSNLATVKYRALIPATQLQHIVGDQDTVTIWGLRFPRMLVQPDEALNITAGSFDRRRLEDLVGLDANERYEMSVAAGFEETDTKVGRTRVVKRLLEALGYLPGDRSKLGTNYRVGFASQSQLNDELQPYLGATTTLAPRSDLAPVVGNPPANPPARNPSSDARVPLCNDSGSLGAKLGQLAFGRSVGQPKNSPGGAMWYGKHCGYDYMLPRGTPVYAVADGVVKQVRTWVKGDKNNTYGNHVIIGNDRVWVAYAHFDAPPTLKLGDRVRRGDRVGVVGATGLSDGSHLHLEAMHAGGKKLERTASAQCMAYNALWEAEAARGKAERDKTTAPSTPNKKATPFVPQVDGSNLHRVLAEQIFKNPLRGSVNLPGSSSTVGGHSGYDLNQGAGNSDEGTMLYSPVAGVVSFVGRYNDYGNVIIVSNGKYRVLFAHLQDPGGRVGVGTRVQRGTFLARLGRTGTGAASSHLHMEVFGAAQPGRPGVEGAHGTYNPVAKNVGTYVQVFKAMWYNDAGATDFKLTPEMERDMSTPGAYTDPYAGDTSDGYLGSTSGGSDLERVVGSTLYEHLFTKTNDATQRTFSPYDPELEQLMREVGVHYYKDKGAGKATKTTAYRALARSFMSFAAFGNVQTQPDLAEYIPLSGDKQGAQTMALGVFLSFLTDQPDATSGDNDEAFLEALRTYIADRYGQARKREGLVRDDATERNAVSNLIGNIIGNGGLMEHAYGKLREDAKRGQVPQTSEFLGLSKANTFTRKLSHGETPFLLMKGQVKTVTVGQTLSTTSYEQTVRISGLGMGQMLREHQIVYDELNRERVMFKTVMDYTIKEAHPLRVLTEAMRQFAPLKLKMTQRGESEIQNILDTDKPNTPSSNPTLKYWLAQGNVFAPYFLAPMSKYQIFTPRHFVSTRYLNNLITPFENFMRRTNAQIMTSMTLTDGSLFDQMKRFLGSNLYNLHVDEFGYLRFRYEVEAWDRVPDGMVGAIITDDDLTGLEWSWDASKIFTIVDVSPAMLAMNSNTAGSTNYGRSIPLPVSKTEVGLETRNLTGESGDPMDIAKTVANLQRIFLDALKSIDAQLHKDGNPPFAVDKLWTTEGAAQDGAKALLKNASTTGMINKLLQRINAGHLLQASGVGNEIYSSYGTLMQYLAGENIQGTLDSGGYGTMAVRDNLVNGKDDDTGGRTSLLFKLYARMLKGIRAQDPTVGSGHVMVDVITHLKTLKPTDQGILEDDNLQEVCNLLSTLTGLNYAPELVGKLNFMSQGSSRAANVLWASVSTMKFWFLEARNRPPQTRGGQNKDYTYTDALTLGRLPMDALKLQQTQKQRVSVGFFKYGARRVLLNDIYASSNSKITSYRAEHYRRFYQRSMLRARVNATLISPVASGSTVLVYSEQQEFIHDYYVTRGFVNFYKQVLDRHRDDQKTLLQYVGFHPMFYRQLQLDQQPFQVDITRSLVTYQNKYGLNFPELTSFEQLLDYAGVVLGKLEQAVERGPVQLTSYMPTYGAYSVGGAVGALQDALFAFGATPSVDNEKQVLRARDDVLRSMVPELDQDVDSAGTTVEEAESFLNRIIYPQTQFAAQVYVESTAHSFDFGSRLSTTIEGGHGKPCLMITLPVIKDGDVVGSIPLMWFNLKPGINWFDDNGAESELMPEDNHNTTFIKESRQAEMDYQHAQMRFSGKGIMETLRTLFIYDLTDRVQTAFGAAHTYDQAPPLVRSNDAPPSLSLGSAVSNAVVTAPQKPQAQSGSAPETHTVRDAVVSTPPNRRDAAPADQNGPVKTVGKVKGIIATAYNAAPQQTDSTPNITAINKAIKPGTIAVSPNLLTKIPYGSVVYIKVIKGSAQDKAIVNGRRFYVEDSMSESKTDMIDIYMEEHSDAIAWGRKEVEIEFISKGPLSPGSNGRTNPAGAQQARKNWEHH